MKKGMRSNADGVLEKKRRGQKWKRLAGVLGCLVVIVTAYVLMRPAETLERELICGMEEHQHSVEQGCYQEIAAEPAQPICGMEEAGHVHSEECYSAVSVLTCTEPEGDGHQHDKSCYTMETTLICDLSEADGHTHTAECYPAEDAEAEPELELVCELPEHTHTEDCYADDAAQHAQVEEVAALIDALPSAVEVEARLEELLAAEDAEAYDAYCAELARQVEQANTAYEALTDEQQAQLNIDKLTALFVYLPAKEGTFTLTAPATESGIIVTISGETASLPFPVEELTLTAVEVEDENANALRDEALESEELTAAENYMLDIRLMHGEEEVQPTGPITVTFAGLPLDGGADVALVDDVDDNADTDAEPVTYQAKEMAAQAVAANAADDMDMSEETTDDTVNDAGESSVTGPKVYQIDEDTQQATEVDVAVNDENNVVLETDQLTNLYSVSLLAATSRATGNVSDLSSLNKQLSNGKNATLSKNILIDCSKFSTTWINMTYLVKVKGSPTLNLNGYSITLKNSNKAYMKAIFLVQPGATLTVTDSTVGTSETLTATTVTGTLKPASYSASTLTYSRTESSENNQTDHTTKEVRKDYRVTLGGGAIIGDNRAGKGAFYVQGTLKMQNGYIRNFGASNATEMQEPLPVSAITVAGGTFTMSGGVVAGNANRTGGAIKLTGSATMNMSNGYIAGNTAGTYGGAIYVLGGSAQLNISGGVIAANKSLDVGGAIAMAGGTFNLTGGVISGNQAARQGGAVYCRTRFNMQGGYITNNKITVEAGYVLVKFQCGGGGVFLDQGSKFNMYGGYITCNVSTMRGGGICTYYLENDKLPTTSYAEITINGGFISSNCARGHEGGGINCDSGSKCTIEKKNVPIYISNNRMQTAKVWGGGGIYIGHTATLYIKNSLLTKNSADGLGGGYGSCTTADSFFYLGDGTAIFDNTAGGKDRGGDAADYKLHVYPSSASKTSIKGVGDPPDVFAGGKTRLYATMLGGGDPRWRGSRDGNRLTLNQADILCTSNKVMGLKSNPSNNAKTAARNAAGVYITGNTSSMHGAGIMSNGIVYFGTDTWSDKYLPTRVAITATKVLLQEDGQAETPVSADMFQFSIVDASNGKVVSTAATDSTGSIAFDWLSFSEVGTHTYQIKEIVTPSTAVQYDTTSYTMTVKLDAAKEIINTLGAKTGVHYYPTTVTIINDLTGEQVFRSEKVHDEPTIILQKSASGGAAFTNRLKKEEYSVNVTKVDSGDPTHTLAGAEFTLEVKSGADYTPVSGVASGTAGVYTYVADASTSGAVTTFVTAENGNLQIVGLPAGDYKLTETKAPEGYLIAEEWQTGKEFKLNKTGATTGAYTVTVADPPATYTFQFLKVSEADKTKPVPNAKYQLLDSEGQEVKFTKAGTEYQYSTSGTVTELITDKDGRFQLTGLPRGSYTLREIEAPAGFGLADDYSFELSPEKTVDQVFTYTQEEPVVYELPETGGGGVKPYVITGAALLVGAACLTACRDKRRKAGGRTF